VAEEETSNVGAIVGGVVGGITALVILIAVGFCYRAKSVSTNAVAAGSATVDGGKMNPIPLATDNSVIYP